MGSRGLRFSLRLLPRRFCGEGIPQWAAQVPEHERRPQIRRERAGLTIRVILMILIMIIINMILLIYIYIYIYSYNYIYIYICIVYLYTYIHQPAGPASHLAGMGICKYLVDPCVIACWLHYTCKRAIIMSSLVNAL